jgi:hypothetical protein
MPCPEPPKGLRNPSSLGDGPEVYLAQKAAQRQGLCTYLDNRDGRITLLDPSTKKVEKSGLVPEEVFALYW